MGPALLPTPLSPACGPPKGCLAPGVSPCSRCPKARCCPDMSPGARAGAGADFPIGDTAKRSQPIFPPVRDRLCPLVLQAVLSTPECLHFLGTGFLLRPFPMIAACGLNSPFGVLLPKKRSAALSSSARLLPSRRFRPVSPVSGSASDPSWWRLSVFDDWRMRAATESGKGASVHLSTSGAIASGQGWISQRLTARLAVDVQFCPECGEKGLAAVPLSQQPQPQGVQFDEAARIGLVVSTRVILEGDVRFRIERV